MRRNQFLCVAIATSSVFWVAAMPAAAQHLDVLVAQSNGKLVTGSADFDTGQWTIGRRVYFGEFDGDFAVNNPGFNALAAGSPSLPTGAQALLGSNALGWDFTTATIHSLESNLFYWNGLESDGIPGLSPGDVAFGALPGPNYSLALFDKSGVSHSVTGTNQSVPGGILDDTASDGSLHRHRFYQLQDGDGITGTLPADGIYLFALSLRMNGLTRSDPIFMVFGTPGSSIEALDDAAVPWAEENLVVLGDYNGNGSVDVADYVVWRMGGTLQNEVATPNVNTEDDYFAWRARYGKPALPAAGHSSTGHAVPEPANWSLCLALTGGLFRRRRH